MEKQPVNVPEGSKNLVRNLAGLGLPKTAELDAYWLSRDWRK